MERTVSVVMGIRNVTVVVTVFPGNGRTVVVVWMLLIVVVPPTVAINVTVCVAVDVTVVRGTGG